MFKISVGTSKMLTLARVFIVLKLFLWSLSYAQDTIYFPTNKVMVIGELENGKMVGTWLGYDSLTNCNIKLQMMNSSFSKCEVFFLDSASSEGYFKKTGAIIYKKDLVWHGEQILQKEGVKLVSNFWYGKQIGQRRNYGGLYLKSLYWEIKDTSRIFSTNFSNETGGLISYGSINLHRQNEGISILFYENGEIKSQGHYQDGLKIGEWSYYHSNGNVSERGKYFGDYFLVENIVYPENIVNKDNIPIEQIYPKVKFDFSNIKHSPYYFYLKNGKWEYYDEMGNLTRLEYYDKGELKKVKSYKVKK